MNELFTWEYKGKQEYGTKDSGLWPLWIMNHEPDKKGNTRFRRQLNEVTNLRPAKVVDADAVVIKGITEAELVWFSEGVGANGSYSHAAFPESLRSIKNRILKGMKNPTPPVTEPTGFGAIVEAGFRFTDGDNRQKWVSSPTFQRTLVWHSENCAMQPWENLINPVVISGGVTK